MGKLIQFPMARLPQRGRPAVTVSAFGAFNELESSERTQLRFIAGSLVIAVVFFGVLQLAFG